MSRRCAAYAELRSGLVDGALSAADRERVAGHLLHCADCRRDVAELRAVRELLGRAQVPVRPAPLDLSSRLVSIAGDTSQVPLWSRPFRRTRAGALPSSRRLARLRTTVGVVAVGALVSVLGVVGYAAAPVAELSAVADPVDEARAEFAAAVGQLSVAGSSLTALMLLDAVGPSASTTSTPSPGAARGRALSARQAESALVRSATAFDQVSLVGRQSVQAHHGDVVTAAMVKVDTRSGQGSQLSVLDASGAAVSTTFSPAVAGTADPAALVTSLTQTYALSGRTGATVAGRAATEVEARQDGRVAKRWWVDDATGVLLWQESYDAAGEPAVSTGFATVKISSGGIIEHLPPRVLSASVTTTLDGSEVPALSAAGWSCADDLAGLDLLEMRGNRADDPDVVHTVYGDGLRTVSVLQQRGSLTAAPADATWDASLGAWTHDGAVAWATWQSGSTVITVTTDGSTDLLERAAAALPRERPIQSTTLARIRDGWSRILADMKG